MEAGAYTILFRILMFVVGAIVGSFLCCQARRLRNKELGGKKLGKRSVCLSCGETLGWWDNLPIVSWIFLRGKCRKCGNRIGAAEILAEVLTGAAFLLLSFTVEVGTATGIEWVEFFGLFVFTAVLVFLAIYDGLYGELPSLCLTILAICAIIIIILKQWSLFLVGQFSLGGVLETVLAGAVLAVPYGGLYLASRGKWVGDGDWILGLAMGLVLGEPFLGLVALFVTNLVASGVMYPLCRGRKTRKIFMGPFMAAGFVVTYSFAEVLMGLIRF